MQFKLPRDRRQLREHLNALDANEYTVTVEPYKANRSLAQNSLMWKWCEIIGNEFGYTSLEMKRELCYKYLGFQRHMVSGNVTIEINGTSKLKIKEFTDFLRNVEIFAGEAQIRLPFPDQQYNEAMGIKE